MNSKLIYDLPTRLFHATFALLFIAAFVIAKRLDDESARYGFHMIFGMIMVFTVALRIIWGLIGSEYAKFKHFAISPKELVEYLKSAMLSKSKKYLGHNPASSYAAIGMMLMSLLLFASGYQMIMKIDKEIFEEFHEIFAHLFLLSAVSHVVGIIIHTIKHKDLIGLSMVNGHKNTDLEVKEVKQNVFAALIYIIAVAGMSFYLITNYNMQSGELNAFGKKLVLVEVEGEN